MIKKVVAIIVFVMVVSSSIVGCTSQQQTTQTIGNATAATNADMAVAVKPVTLSQQIGTETPRPGYKFVAYDCTVKNINAQGRAVAINYFTLEDTQGKVYNFSGLSSDPSINNFKWSSHSQPGDTLGGVVVFEVPRNATLASLTYFDGSTKVLTTL